MVNKLKELGLYENTIIVNTSDHGDMDTYHRLVFKGPFMYEHMMRIPLSIRIPGIAGKQSSYQWVNVDTVPTLLELAGAKPYACDGQSVVPVLTQKGKQPARDFVIGQYYGKQTWVNPIRTIRTSEWKYSLYTDWGEELYDLKNDPEEITNVAGDSRHAAIREQLRRQLDQWMTENKDPFYSFSTTSLDRNEAKTILRKS